MLRSCALVATLLLSLAPASASAPQEAPGEVFDKAVSLLERYYHDKEFRKQTLPGLAAELRERAQAAVTPAEERAVLRELLSKIQTSHLGLMSVEAYHRLGAELFGNTFPTFGLQLVLVDDRYHADWIFEGGPADLAGVKRGDQVLGIDGVAPEACPRLDWRTDDAALPDAPIHELNAEEGDIVKLAVRRQEGVEFEFVLEAVAYSGWRAAEASARVIERGEQRFGYVHYWYIQQDKPSELLKKLIDGDFAACDGLILDLRGRGGTAMEVVRLLNLLHPETGSWNRPVVALTNRGTRSAKEVIAYRLKDEGLGTVVGERTAGAVIPATFKKIGGGAVLVFPALRFGHFTEEIEGKGVAPDVEAVDRLPFTAGKDPILEAGLTTLAEKCEPVGAGN